MLRCELPRVVSAARRFISAITLHAEQYDAPGYERERQLACAKVAHAASELHLAIEGRTIFDPPLPADDLAPRGFVGTGEMDATIRLSVVRECMRRLLRRIGYVGEQVEGAAFGRMPSMKGLENLPQVGLPELPHLIRATDELEALTNTPTMARPEAAGPTARLQVFDRPVPPPGNVATDTPATPESNGGTVEFYERLDGTTGWFSKGASPNPYTSPARGGSEIRHFLVKVRDEENGQRSWIRFTWGPFALLKPPNARHPYRQISVNEAAAWFSENCLSPPATLLDDLRTEQEATKAPANPPAPPREDKQPAAAPAPTPVTTEAVAPPNPTWSMRVPGSTFIGEENLDSATAANLWETHGHGTFVKVDGEWHKISTEAYQALLISAAARAVSGDAAELPDLVTLNQAAGIVKRSKRTLENYKTKGKLPAPAVEGGGGQPDLWDWEVLRPWLEATFKRKLPVVFPDIRRNA